MTTFSNATELRKLALEALLEPDSEQKVAFTQWIRVQAATISIATDITFPEPAGVPGCPARPELRSHLDVPKRSPFTTEGLAALLHAVTHIEFNAINLALDAIWRFDAMPRSYYLDWLTVAAEEAHHFSLLRAHLQGMGYDYGDFPAHTGLWDMTEKTKSDVLRKVATPHALRAVEILDVILRDEIGHVAIGNHWYRHLCAQRRLDPVAHYAVLAKQYDAPRIKGPLNLAARRKAGFEEAELALLKVGISPSGVTRR